MADSSWLNLLLFLPLLGGLALLAVPRQRQGTIRAVTFAAMLAQFLIAWHLYNAFDAGVPGLQFETRLPWIAAWGVYYQIGLDGYNVLLILLTAFLGPLVVAGAFTAIDREVKLFYAMVLLLQFAMTGAFVAQDLFLFYVFWEAMMIPMFLIIGIWGGPRRIYATIKFVLYTAFGSILMLAAMIYLVYSLPSADGQLVVRLRRPLSCAPAAGHAGHAALRVRAVVRDQGADRPAAHLAPRRARGGADRRLRDPGRRVAEDGHVRLHEARLSAVPRRDDVPAPVLHGDGGAEHRVRRVPGAGAGRHQEDHRLFVDQPPGLRDAGPRQPRPHRHPGRGGADGEPRPDRRRPVPARRHDLRALPHPRAVGLRRARQAAAGLLGLLHGADAGLHRPADHQRLHRRVPGAARRGSPPAGRRMSRARPSR